MGKILLQGIIFIGDTTIKIVQFPIIHAVSLYKTGKNRAEQYINDYKTKQENSDSINTVQAHSSHKDHEGVAPVQPPPATAPIHQEKQEESIKAEHTQHSVLTDSSSATQNDLIQGDTNEDQSSPSQNSFDLAQTVAIIGQKSHRSIITIGKKLRQHFSTGSKKVSQHATPLLGSVGSVLWGGLSFVGKMISLVWKIIYWTFASNFRYFYIGFFSCLLIIFGFQSYDFIQKLPSPESIGELNYPLSSHLYDRNDKLLYEIYSDENRTPIKLSELPEFVPQASIAIEDKDFFKHAGISPISGILRAIKDTYRTKELQGGSTITQQLVKSALLTPERTVQRKVKEMILALWAERIYTKEDILEMYLNQVPYGGSSYGVEEASKTFFGKPATDLTLSEAAFLAGLPRAPSIYSPYINPELARERRDQVLRNMYELGYISLEEKEEAQAVELAVLPPKTTIKAPHFVFYIKSELEKQYGIKQVEEGGLRITTSVDLEIQEEAEKILREELEKVQHMNISNGAILVTKPRTGEIVAMVGSQDYFASPSGSFNVTTALRQPGSTIKPVMYALALQNGGYTAATMINDSKVVYKAEGAPPYIPVNYDNKYRGNVTLRFSLSNSLNIPAVKVLDSVGVQNFANHAQRMGIDTWTDPSRFGLSLTLGGVEVTMLDMAEAFGVFANQGYRVNLNGILDINNSDQEKIYSPQNSEIKVLNEGVAFIVSDIMSDSETRRAAFGSNSALEMPNRVVSVKTGTTNDVKDNWTIGFTQEYLVATWVGNNDNTPMNKYLVSGITGAAPIWNRVMTYILDNKAENPEATPTPPANIVAKKCLGRTEYFVQGTENTVRCVLPKKKDDEEKKEEENKD